MESHFDFLHVSDSNLALGHLRHVQVERALVEDDGPTGAARCVSRVLGLVEHHHPPGEAVPGEGDVVPGGTAAGQDGLKETPVVVVTVKPEQQGQLLIRLETDQGILALLSLPLRVELVELNLLTHVLTLRVVTDTGDLAEHPVVRPHHVQQVRILQLQSEETRLRPEVINIDSAVKLGVRSQLTC